MKEKEYHTLFKCRLCGETFEPGGTGSRDIAVNAVIFAALGKPYMPQSPTLYDTHLCKNGGIGIADFLGFKEIETEDDI